jgi:serine protease
MPSSCRIVLVSCAVGITLATSPPVLGQRAVAPNQLSPDVVKKLLERRRPQGFVPGEIIVKRKVVAGVAMALPAARLAELRLGPVAQQLSGGEGLYRIEQATISALTPQDARARTLSVIAQLRASPEVEYAQPNYVAQIAAPPNDPLYPRQWNLHDHGSEVGRSPGGISAQTAWDQTTGSSSVVVAVVDTGILPDHADIQGSAALVAGYDLISSAAMANDGGGRDNDPTDPGDAVAADECWPGSPALPDSWHGTHVAGIVGVVRANNSLGVAGVTWDGRVQPVRVLGKCGGTTADINDGIRWAAGLPVPGVPANATPAKVINLSLRAYEPCSNSPATQAAIDDAVNAGATVVVAAGNDGVDASNVYPASCNNVITVAASDARGHLVTRYSNYGATVEILAPGGDIERDDDRDGNPDGVYSTVKGGYAYYNGTSMAAPHVAGAAALLLARQPGLSPAQVSQDLQHTALPRTAAECPKPCGAGLLSAATVLNVDASPASVKLKKGQSETFEVLVHEGAQPKPGKTVTFQSKDPSIATVSPASRTTDGQGRASTTVTGQEDGDTSVDSEVDAVHRETPVKVPLFSGAFVLLLVASMFGAARRLTRGRKRTP